MTFRSERLDPERHDARDFSCGEPTLDVWLREQAVPATARRTARTWVWVDEAGEVADGFRRFPDSLLLAQKVADIEAGLSTPE